VKGLLAVLVFAMVWPTAAAMIYFIGLASQPYVYRVAGPNIWLQSFYAGSKVIQFALPVLWLAACQPERLRIQKPTFGGLGWGLGFGLLIAGAILLAYFGFLRGTSLLHQTPEQLRAKVEDFGADTPLRFVLLCSFISLIHSFLEEYYWRWFVFGELRRLVSVGAAILLSSLTFMAHHVVVLFVYFPRHFWTGAVPFSLAIAVGGAYWAWLYHRSASIYSTWISHLLIDAAIMAVGFDLLFG
jgi:membrane protease YdiL (CAAX protease family)